MSSQFLIGGTFEPPESFDHVHFSRKSWMHHSPHNLKIMKTLSQRCCELADCFLEDGWLFMWMESGSVSYTGCGIKIYPSEHCIQWPHFFQLGAPNFTLCVLKMCFIISRKLRRLLLLPSLAMSVQASFKKLEKYYRMVGRKGLHRGDSCQPPDYRQSPRNWLQRPSWSH